MIERIRRALGGSPGDHADGHSSSPAPRPGNQQHLDLLRDTARDLCSDPWLANQISLEVATVNGKQTIRYMPAESMPYVRAAYAIRKGELPPEMGGLFDGMAS